MAAAKKQAKTKDKSREAPLAEGGVSPRIARRDRRRERSREEIVEAARRVLVREGIGATTLEAVAREVGLTKAAIYYYYPSKDALYFDLIFEVVHEQATAIASAVEPTATGGEALGAIARATVESLASRLDDFRLAFLHGQVAGTGAVRFTPEQFAQLRPLNDLAYGSTARRLASEWERAPGRARVDPRMMAFLAYTSALGLLMMKGMVESVGDPLLYSDAQLIEGLAAIFESAAAP